MLQEIEVGIVGHVFTIGKLLQMVEGGIAGQVFTIGKLLHSTVFGILLHRTLSGILLQEIEPALHVTWLLGFKGLQLTEDKGLIVTGLITV